MGNYRADLELLLYSFRNWCARCDFDKRAPWSLVLLDELTYVVGKKNIKKNRKNKKQKNKKKTDLHTATK